MALSKGKKILIAVVAGVVAIGTTIGVVLGIQNSKDPGPDIPSIDTPVDPNPDTPVDPTPDDPVDPTPDDPVDPTPDDPVDPDPDTPVDPDPGEEEPETPEISEAEYYKKNLDLLKSALKEEYEKDNPGETFNLDDSSEILINEVAGEIYCLANTIGKYGDVRGIRFYVASFDNNILNKSQEEIYSYLNSTEKNYDLSFISQTRLKPNLSEEGYNEFSEYICNQKYESNGEIITFSEDAQVLDISRYIYDYDAHGNTYFQYFIIDNGKVYTARLENAMPPELSDWGIGQIMGYSNNVFKITEIKDFKEFDYEEEAAQAQSEFFLDLSEVAISKDQAQDLANAIRTSNPKKLGNMEVKLPAGNPDFEL